MNEIKDLNHANNLRLLSMKKEIAKILLDKKAVTLNIKEPYTYASGIRSPMYCDNRVLTYFPVERDIVVQGYVDLIKDHPKFHKIKEKHDSKEMVKEIEKALKDFAKMKDKKIKNKKIVLNNFGKEINNFLEN